MDSSVEIKNQSLVKLKNFINGKFIEPQCTTYFNNYDPSTGDVYALTPNSEAIDVVLAIQAAQKAFSLWSQKSANDRAGFLHRIADLMDRDKDEIARLESKDVGKPLWLAREVDVPRAILNFRYFASLIATHSESSRSEFKGFSQYTLREPFGVTGLITPWNLPLYTLTFKLAPSLAVGNAVVCKPSEYTPMTAYKLAELLVEAELPDGVCNIVFGQGERAGQPLAQHPGVPMISFTGSTTTGQKLHEIANHSLKRLSLELGGKNACIVLNDADIEKAVESAVRSSFINSGQVCLSNSRLLIEQGIYNEFMSEFRKRVQNIVVGDPLEQNTFMGPLVSLEQKNKVINAIEQAKKEEGKVTVGGGVPNGLSSRLKNGYFIAPTVIEDLTNCSDLWQTEIFGPVVTTMTFKYAHEAVKWANTSPYGLSASLWTSDLTRAHKLAGLIQVGTIWVNSWAARDVAIPFGGAKLSGLGVEGGVESLKTYTQNKTVCIQL